VYHEETGEYQLLFPPGLPESLDWKEGDDLEWVDLGNNHWSIRKVHYGEVNEGLSVGREISPEDSAGDDPT
jgi:bifunctional DNA-binding transcriptional regulator/antitoxin component of YhaV-PrlF toxin-antitoxin module